MVRATQNIFFDLKFAGLKKCTTFVKITGVILRLL